MLTSISVITQNSALRAEIKFAFFRARSGRQCIVLLHKTFVCDYSALNSMGGCSSDKQSAGVFYSDPDQM